MSLHHCPELIRQKVRIVQTVTNCCHGLQGTKPYSVKIVSHVSLHLYENISWLVYSRKYKLLLCHKKNDAWGASVVGVFLDSKNGKENTVLACLKLKQVATIF